MTGLPQSLERNYFTMNVMRGTLKSRSPNVHGPGLLLVGLSRSRENEYARTLCRPRGRSETGGTKTRLTLWNRTAHEGASAKALGRGVVEP